MDNYTQFIQKLVSGNKILSRRFFVIIPYHSSDSQKDFKIIKEQLSVTRDIILRGLEKLGMKVKTLNSLELLDLFYSFYNADQIKTQILQEEAVIAHTQQTYV